MKYLLFVWVCLPATLMGQGFRVDSFHADIRIDSSASFTVREHYRVNFSSSAHGLWRKIPLLYQFRNRQGGREKRRIILSAFSAGGRPCQTHVENGYFSARIGDPGRLVSGVQDYTLSYRVEGAYLFSDSSVQCYWNLLGDTWDADIDHATFSVQLPGAMLLPQDAVAVYTGLHGSAGQAAEYHIRQGGVDGRSLETLGHGRDMTLLVTLPPGSVAAPSPLRVWSRTYGWILIPLLLTLIVYAVWRRFGRDDHFAVAVAYQAPEGVDPALAGFLINDRKDRRDLVALIPYWGAAGLLKIEEKKGAGLFARSDTILHRLAALPADAPAYSRILFEGLFSGGDEVSVRSLRNRFYKTMERAGAELGRQAARSGYYLASSRRATIVLTVLIFLLGFLGFSWMKDAFGLGAAVAWGVVCTLLIVFTRRYMIKPSPEGTALKRQLSGFRMFMEKAERPRLETLLREDPAYFEKTLGYALAFGMVREWSRRFDGLDLRPPSWYEGHPGATFSARHFARGFSASMDGMQQAMASAPASSGRSAGGSSGGGFGGGGGGSW